MDKERLCRRTPRGAFGCSLDAYERVVDAIFSMPSDLLAQDEVPGTPNSLQARTCHTLITTYSGPCPEPVQSLIETVVQMHLRLAPLPSEPAHVRL